MLIPDYLQQLVTASVLQWSALWTALYASTSIVIVLVPPVSSLLPNLRQSTNFAIARNTSYSESVDSSTDINQN